MGERLSPWSINNLCFDSALFHPVFCTYGIFLPIFIIFLSSLFLLLISITFLNESVSLSFIPGYLSENINNVRSIDLQYLWKRQHFWVPLPASWSSCWLCSSTCHANGASRRRPPPRFSAVFACLSANLTMALPPKSRRT